MSSLYNIDFHLETVMSRCFALAVLLAFAVSGNMNPAFAEKSEEKRGVTAEAKVMATPELAYQALRSMRDEDPSGCRVLSTNDSESLIEEIFDGLPLIGKATCVYREVYEPGKKVSFKMLRSDKLKAFEGEWTLKPIDNGQHTLVSLRSYIDTGIKVPFAKQLTETASAGEIKQQVADMKKSAELKQKRTLAGTTNKGL